VTPAATNSAISVAEYHKMSKQDDTAAIAGQLADLHRAVESMTTS
jgi:hypothetical protein